MAGVVALFLLLFAAISAAALQGNSLINLLSSLTPTTNPAWLSSSKTFAFGFRNTADGYAVCIFFADFKERTVVWTANNENPIVPDDVVLLLTEGGLVLHKRDSQDISSRIDNSSQPIETAEMLDNGNFVLYNSYSSVIWQSFDYPTDSLLPGQRCFSPELQRRTSRQGFSGSGCNLMETLSCTMCTDWTQQQILTTRSRPMEVATVYR